MGKTKTKTKTFKKYRKIIIITPSYKNKKYLDIKEEYNRHIKEFHKRHTRLKTEIILKKQSKKVKFKSKSKKLTQNIKIKLIGFDGTIKKSYTKFITKKILKDIDNMPLSKLNSKIKPGNLGLYADYKPETTIHGLGFKNKEKALETIEKIKNKSYKYQMSVVTTMIGRARFHPYKTKEMEDAIKVFEDWIKKNKK